MTAIVGYSAACKLYNLICYILNHQNMWCLFHKNIFLNISNCLKYKNALRFSNFRALTTANSFQQVRCVAYDEKMLQKWNDRNSDTWHFDWENIWKNLFYRISFKSQHWRQNYFYYFVYDIWGFFSWKNIVSSFNRFLTL